MALAYDEGGWPIWRSIVFVVPRKNGKTQLLAALALSRLLTSEGRPEILLAAASDRQAGRLFDACARFVRRSEELSALLRVRDHEGSIVREAGGGRAALRVVLRRAPRPRRAGRGGRLRRPHGRRARKRRPGHDRPLGEARGGSAGAAT